MERATQHSESATKNDALDLPSPAALEKITDAVLRKRISSLRARENASLAWLILHLAEAERRRFHLREGYSSMFKYCVQALHLSEPAAYWRIRAARLSRRYPDVPKRLATGQIHLSALMMLSAHLTDDNHVELLNAARHKSKDEIRELLAGTFPTRPPNDFIRKAPVRDAALAPSPQRTLQQPAAPQPSVATARPPDPPAPEPSQQRGSMRPVSSDEYLVRVTCRKQTRDKLLQLIELCRHRVPNGDLSTIIEMAADLLLEKVKKERFGLGRRHRTGKATKGNTSRNRHIPDAIRAEVYERDDGRCTYRGRDGRRCNETSFLELHHRDPFAKGGPHTAANLTLHCRAHNQYEAAREYGDSPPSPD